MLLIQDITGQFISVAGQDKMIKGLSEHKATLDISFMC